MEHHKPNLEHLALTRRDFLRRCGMGMGALSLASLCFPISAARAAEFGMSPLMPKPPQFPAKAKRVIHIFANGGPSHVDTFDPKPALEKYVGKLLPMENLRTERKTGAGGASPISFKPSGNCSGAWRNWKNKSTARLPNGTSWTRFPRNRFYSRSFHKRLFPPALKSSCR